MTVDLIELSWLWAGRVLYSVSLGLKVRDTMEKIKLSGCFMHFEGISEQLSKVSRPRIKKFVECRSKWVKLDCQQAEIAASSYEKFDDESVGIYLQETETINLEWYHHMKCYKKFCDEEKIRRQAKKEDMKPCTSNEQPPGEPSRKLTRTSTVAANKTLPQKNKHVLPERCIICQKDSSWFSKDKVSYFLLF